MLSIAKIAGHAELNSQTGYYNHVRNFVDSYVYNLAMYDFTENMSSNFNDGFIGWRREVIDRGKMYSLDEANKTLRKITYGFCSDKEDFPNNCDIDCRPCSFYIFKPSLNEYEESVKWLEDYSNDIGTHINEIVESMIITSESLSKSYRPDLDETFKSKSRQLQQLMDHKHQVEYKIIGEF